MNTDIQMKLKVTNLHFSSKSKKAFVHKFQIPKIETILKLHVRNETWKRKNYL